LGKGGAVLAVLLTMRCLQGCGGPDDPKATATGPDSWSEADAADGPRLSEQIADLEHDPIIELARTPWKGDLDGMIERRMVRVLVVPSRTHYWVELGRHSGIEFELVKAFETWLGRKNRHLKKYLRPQVVFIPTTTDHLIPDLLAGRGDIAAAMLTITPERSRKVAFSAPYARDVREVVVTGPQAPPLESLEDLSGQEIYVRKSSSYWAHLEAFNRRLMKAGGPPAQLVPLPEFLADNDVLEMVNAGLIGITVVDLYEARIWRQAFTDITVHEEMPLNEGGQLAWMIRKKNPKLSAALDDFMRTHRQGTVFGNSVARKYVGSEKFVARATSGKEAAKLRELRGIFEKYAEQYSVDWILMAAQGYQESRLEQGARSPVGAVGVMQVMPATARSLGVGDVRELDSNIHAGVKYSRQLMDQYFEDEAIDELNKGIFVLAAYNAGPARIESLRNAAAGRGLDPNVWFGNVEVIAAERMGSETVTYVSNTFKYYIAFKFMVQHVDEGNRFKERLRDAVPKDGWLRGVGRRPGSGKASTLCSDQWSADQQPSRFCRRGAALRAGVAGEAISGSAGSSVGRTDWPSTLVPGVPPKNRAIDAVPSKRARSSASASSASVGKSTSSCHPYSPPSSV
jgi:membrane-bound lytic murein transglycosylase MltF